MLPHARAAYLKAGNDPQTVNTPPALISTESGIVDSSLPAADEGHTSENEPTLAEQIREWRLRDIKISGKRPSRRSHNNASRDAHPEKQRHWWGSKHDDQGDAHPTVRPSGSTHIPTHIPQQSSQISQPASMRGEGAFGRMRRYQVKLKWMKQSIHT